MHKFSHFLLFAYIPMIYFHLTIKHLQDYKLFVTQFFEMNNNVLNNLFIDRALIRRWLVVFFNWHMPPPSTSFYIIIIIVSEKRNREPCWDIMSHKAVHIWSFWWPKIYIPGMFVLHPQFLKQSRALKVKWVIFHVN